MYRALRLPQYTRTSHMRDSKSAMSPTWSSHSNPLGKVLGKIKSKTNNKTKVEHVEVGHGYCTQKNASGRSRSTTCPLDDEIDTRHKCSTTQERSRNTKDKAQRRVDERRDKRAWLLTNAAKRRSSSSALAFSACTSFSTSRQYWRWSSASALSKMRKLDSWIWWHRQCTIDQQ